ncbi:MAG TPA: hypothetical protein VK395_02285 [Gemmataceae bacterium]|nr:hypothetical protein [Gemmataceae bacterium]
MLQASDFEDIQAQAVIYTPGLNLHTTRVLAQLLAEHADTFNGDPMTFPLPEGFPFSAESVRFVLQSSDGKLRLQAAPSRLDLFQASLNAEEIRPLPEFMEWCLALFDKYLDITQGRVGRLAATVNRRASAAEPAKEIASHFCKPEFLDGPLNRPSDFEIHAAKQFDFLDGLKINSWFRCKTAILISRPAQQQQKAVVVDQDFNTLPEELETREFSREAIRQFFREVPNGLKEVLDLYFPVRRNQVTNA